MTAEVYSPQYGGKRYPIPDMMGEIADMRNIEDSFDYVVSHLECADQREHIRPHKAAYCLWDILEQYEEADGLPVYVVGEVDFSERFPKLSFVSPKKYGLTSPSDAELDRLLTQLNLKQQL